MKAIVINHSLNGFYFKKAWIDICNAKGFLINTSIVKKNLSKIDSTEKTFYQRKPGKRFLVPDELCLF